MKEPIELDGGHLSSIICAMLNERGQDSFTLTFEKFEELDLGNFGLECEGVFEDGDDTPTAIIVTVRRV